VNFTFDRQNHFFRRYTLCEYKFAGVPWHSNESCPGTMQLADHWSNRKPEGHWRCCRIGQNGLALEGIR